jgi:hypothetical protein
VLLVQFLKLIKEPKDIRIPRDEGISKEIGVLDQKPQVLDVNQSTSRAGYASEGSGAAKARRLPV